MKEVFKCCVLIGGPFLQFLMSGWLTGYTWRCDPVDTSNDPQALRVSISLPLFSPPPTTPCLASVLLVSLSLSLSQCECCCLVNTMREGWGTEEEGKREKK